MKLLGRELIPERILDLKVRIGLKREVYFTLQERKGLARKKEDVLAPRMRGLGLYCCRMVMGGGFFLYSCQAGFIRLLGMWSANVAEGCPPFLSAQYFSSAVKQTLKDNRLSHRWLSKQRGTVCSDFPLVRNASWLANNAFLSEIIHGVSVNQQEELSC